MIQDALTGREPAVRALVARLTPVIQARVARLVLRRRGGGGAAAIRATVEDLSQEVFLQLFADDARILRSWRPERGLSIENFAGLVATRRALSILRSGKRSTKHSAWLDDPTLDPSFDPASAQPSPEHQAASRQELCSLLDRMRETLSPLGWQLFELLMIRQQTVHQVQATTGLSRDAVYAWRSRLRKHARRQLEELRVTPRSPDEGNPVRDPREGANDQTG